MIIGFMLIWLSIEYPSVSTESEWAFISEYLEYWEWVLRTIEHALISEYLEYWE